jgi:hypothetical protein
MRRFATRPPSSSAPCWVRPPYYTPPSIDGSIGGPNGIQPACYSRNVDVAGTVLFQPAVLFIHIVALLMIAIMVFHIRSKCGSGPREQLD